MTLPTFVVIGAMKAGTVSLSHYLDQHPDVFLGRGGRFGEPSFFVAEQNWPRGRGCASARTTSRPSTRGSGCTSWRGWT